MLALTNYEKLFFVGRFIAGVSFGVYGGVFTVYNKEMSPDVMVGSGGAV